MSEESIKPGFDRVSDIAGCFAPYGKIPYDVLQNAAGRGDHIHKIIYDILNDIPVPNESIEWKGKSVQGYIDSFNRFWDTLKNPKIIMQEDRLYHDNLNTTGKMDMVVDTDEGIYLMDWKTSNKPCKHWDIQAGGYMHLISKGYSERKDPWLRPKRLEGAIFVHLDKNGKEPNLIKFAYEFDTFMLAHRLYRKYFSNIKIDIENL